MQSPVPSSPSNRLISSSNPTLRSQPQSPSRFIENENHFSSNSASPFGSHITLVSKVQMPLTPPNSSGKAVANRSASLGEPINILPSSPTPDENYLPNAQDDAFNTLEPSKNVSGGPPERDTLSPPRSVLEASPVSTRSAVNSPLSFAPASPSNQRQLASQSGIASNSSFTPPNVYINGLPANFPEEQLYNMTKEYGPIISVRTFTRHVSERPTGYGFVLFEHLESAERCIEALRKYRNLHPSLSKQVHKIPGTPYAQLQTPEGSQQGGSDQGAAESFKARMDRCKDEASSNLYIEGLPLSIDEPTLAALMSPYKIMSSRLFQTRLSHPPRIIAFVRLETRVAAEEIIERLHGRMVRGWNDPGCRISVRFADTAEQRELRRQERSAQGSAEQSPARLTIAQASLLNLQGPQAFPPKQPRRESRSHNKVSIPQDASFKPVSDSLADLSQNHGCRKRDQGRSSASKAQNGYTPAEELILAVHAQQMLSRGVPLIPGMDVAHNLLAHSPSIVSPHGSGHVPIVAHNKFSHNPYHNYDYGDGEDIAAGFEGLSITSLSSHIPREHARSSAQPSLTSNYVHHSGKNNSSTLTHPPYEHHNNVNPSLPKNRINTNIHNPYPGVPHSHNEGVGYVADHDRYHENEQSPLVSPTLTFSSQGRTPQTLSPATPFFANFTLGEPFETFKGKENANRVEEF